MIALAAAALVAGAGCSHGAAPPPGAGFQRPPPPVLVVEAVARDVPVYLDHIGRTAASEVVAVRPQVSGKIVDVQFQEGAELKKGDPLFTIDPRPYKAALDQAAATLAERAAQLKHAKAELARVEGMAGSRAISQEDVETRRSTAEVAEAQVSAASAALDTAKVNLEFTSIRSPIDGRAGKRIVDLGNVVGPESGALVVVQRLAPIYVELSIPESQLDEVRRAAAATTTALAVETTTPETPADPARGELTFIDGSVREATGTVLLRAAVANADRRFWPGQFVSARVILALRSGAVLVPGEAVQVGQRGAFVYVVKADATAELRPVTPGQRHGPLVVVDGVAAGERVITVGQLAVQPGGKVTVKDPATLPGAAPAAPEAAKP